MSSGASPSLADRLTTACCHGDLPSAKAAVADGASFSEEGSGPGGWGRLLPLKAAVQYKHYDVVVWLLSMGADPNVGGVMFHGAYSSTAEILQLLIDAGGDVNRESGGRPLFSAVDGGREDNLRLLLAQPSLDVFFVKLGGKPPEEYARDNDKRVLADMIAQEVSRECLL